jgi:hypothetical protein
VRSWSVRKSVREAQAVVFKSCMTFCLFSIVYMSNPTACFTWKEQDGM